SAITSGELMAVGDYIHPHILFETLAYLFGFQLYRSLRSRYGDAVSSPNRWSVIAAAAVGAALGSKLLFFVEDPRFALAHLHDPVFLMGGKTIIGGLMGGLFAVELIKRICGIHVRTGDLFAVPLCLGIAIGRLGCFFTGLSDNTYGIPTALPWGVDFGDGIRRHPVHRRGEEPWVTKFVLISSMTLPSRSARNASRRSKPRS